MIRVIIERRIKEGSEFEFRELISKLRSKALHQPGYVMGETWVGDDDPSLYIVISTWIGTELWQAWERSAERQAIAARLEPLQSAPAKTNVLRSSGEVEVDWDIRYALRSSQS